MSEVFKAIFEAGLQIDEDKLKKLTTENKNYVIGVNLATKQFLGQYMSYYLSSEKQKMNDSYSRFISYMEREKKAHPDVVSYIDDIELVPLTVVRRLASDDPEIKV